MPRSVDPQSLIDQARAALATCLADLALTEDTLRSVLKKLPYAQSPNLLAATWAFFHVHPHFVQTLADLSEELATLKKEIQQCPASTIRKASSTKPEPPSQHASPNSR